jgi:hypothetical protein
MTLYYDAIVAGEQIRTGKLRLYEPHVKNIIVNTVYACLTTYVTARFVCFSVRRRITVVLTITLPEFLLLLKIKTRLQV